MRLQMLIKAVQIDSGVTLSIATSIVEKVFSVIAESVNAGESVKIHGFGKFEIRSRSERVARNPRTGEKIQLPETRVLVFSPSSALKLKLSSACISVQRRGLHRSTEKY